MSVGKPAGACPVGFVVAYLKSLTGTPALSSRFVECNGQTLSDAQSVFNGVVIPNLNGASSGTKRFLRGAATSGATGGTETHTHTIPSFGGYLVEYHLGCDDDLLADHTTNPADTLPSYYQVVWTVRIK